MVFLGELRLPADRENLAPLNYFVRGLGSQLHLNDDAASDLDRAVSKAVSHVIQHADSAGEITIRAETQAQTLQISLTDCANPNNTVTLSHTLEDKAIDPQQRETTTIYSVRAIRSELEAIQSVSEVMTTNINLDDLLKLVIDKLVEAIDANRGTLYLIDEERGELYSKVLLEDTHTLSEIRVKIGDGLAGYVAATGEIVNLEDVYQDPRFNRTYDNVTGYHTQNMLVAPMRNPQQKLIGVVQVLNKNGGAFTKRDERLLVSMSSQAAISIENARLYAAEIEQRLLEQELETARSIQRSFLPTTSPEDTRWDIAAFWEPAKNVAGDFYDLHTLPDGRYAFLIADVCGKGVPAALFMALSVTILRFAMDLDFSPSELLRHANRRILSFNQNSRMFASVFVSYVNPETGELHFASGGHNPPLLYRAATKSLQYIRAKGVLVGLLDDVDFAEEHVVLEPGDVLVLYTDGITEAVSKNDEEFGEKRLEAIVATFATVPAQQIVSRLIDSVNAFCGERGAFDDETLVVIKRNSN